MTIREAAEKLGVTTKTVYKRLNRSDTKGLTEVIKGVTHVTPEGQLYLGIKASNEEPQKTADTYDLVKELLAQLKAKDEQIEMLQRLLDQQQQLQLQQLQQLAAPAKRKWLPPWRKEEKNPS